MARTTKSSVTASLYQLKITLNYTKPAIWRRVVVSSNMRLDRLHDVIQAVMPWTNSHMHQFIAGGNCYGASDPDFGDDFGRQTLDEKRFSLHDIAPTPKSKFIYEYDFGDSWEHQVVVEKVLPKDPSLKHVTCLGGANACPPDDCGGIPGYYDLVEIMADPRHEEHKSMKSWLGGKWDPSKFDVSEADARVSQIRL